MFRSYSPDRPFRVRWMPMSIGVGEGNRGPSITIADFATFAEAMAGKDNAPAGSSADRITRGSDDVVVWPKPDFSPGDPIWIDESIDGGVAVKGTIVDYIGRSDHGMAKLWNVRLEGAVSLVAAPELLLRSRAQV